MCRKNYYLNLEIFNLFQASSTAATRSVAVARAPTAQRLNPQATRHLRRARGKLRKPREGRKGAPVAGLPPSAQPLWAPREWARPRWSASSRPRSVLMRTTVKEEVRFFCHQLFVFLCCLIINYASNRKKNHISFSKVMFCCLGSFYIYDEGPNRDPWGTPDEIVKRFDLKHLQQRLQLLTTV